MEVDMSKTYRTAQGKQVNLEAILSKNEKVPAIGNMSVNARGDEIDSKGNIIKAKNHIMKEYYDLSSATKADESDVFKKKIQQERERARKQRSVQK